MKLISLNTWGGRAGVDKLLLFFEKYKDADIFCLQEVWNGGEHMEGVVGGGVELKGIAYDTLKKTETVLKDHYVYFRPHLGDWYGLALFIKKDLSILGEGELFVYKEKGYSPEGDVGTHARNIQFISFETSNGPRTIVNFHGLWNGKGKIDSEERIEQSEKIVKFLKTINTPYIFCGDFNLLPGTKSLEKLEGVGLRNLISEHGITSTRSSIHSKPDKFADYALVSKDITVNEFKTLPDEISDHLALYLDFD